MIFKKSAIDLVAVISQKLNSHSGKKQEAGYSNNTNEPDFACSPRLAEVSGKHTGFPAGHRHAGGLTSISALACRLYTAPLFRLDRLLTAPVLDEHNWFEFASFTVYISASQFVYRSCFFKGLSLTRFQHYCGDFGSNTHHHLAAQANQRGSETGDVRDAGGIRASGSTRGTRKGRVSQ